MDRSANKLRLLRDLHRSRRKSSNRRKLVRTLRLESLELRRLLAGDVINLRSAFPNDVYEDDGGYFPVAKFASSSGSTPDDFVAMVKWQDGTENVGFVRAEAGEFGVYVARHFDTAGSLNYTLTVFNVINDAPMATQLSPIPSATIHSRVSAHSKTSVTAIPVNINVAQGDAVTTTLLEFTDTNRGRQATDYTATIRWPGSHGFLGTAADSARGKVTFVSPGKFAVTADSTVWFKSVFSGLVEVDIQYAGEDSVTGKSPVLVSGTPITNVTAQAMSQSTSNGQTTEYFEGVIGTFTVDPQHAIDPGNFWGMIQWGDGTQEVSLNNNPTFKILANPASHRTCWSLMSGANTSTY